MAKNMLDHTHNSVSALPHLLADYLHTLPNNHPLQIAIRTYSLALSLSCGPALVTLVTSKKYRSRRLIALSHVLSRELGVTSFAFSMAVAVSGGAAIKQAWDTLAVSSKKLESNNERDVQSFRYLYSKVRTLLSNYKEPYRAFVAHALSAMLGIILLQSRRRGFPRQASIPLTAPLLESTRRTGDAGSSPTLELTLLVLVRAMDAVVRASVLSPVIRADKPSNDTSKEVNLRRKHLMDLDALIFWASSARIMWCFFYDPSRLPRSYNKWIMSIADIDTRILAALRLIREGNWSYARGVSSEPQVLASLAKDLGYPSAWGDVSRIPASGGPIAVAAWKALGVNRGPLGGIPCELVHGGKGGANCSANALVRGIQAFMKAVAIYLPVHVLPLLLTHPKALLKLPKVLETLTSIFRSASFLSTFVSSIWIAVCLTRTLLLARLLPFIPHDFWDGPYGCTFAGSLVCGASIWIEQGRRRGEMALYVLPRALRACLPELFVRQGGGTRIVERLAFALSMATLFTSAAHYPGSLRGLSRWTISFIINGPNVAFWKKKIIAADKLSPTVDVSPKSTSNDVTT